MKKNKRNYQFTTDIAFVSPYIKPIYLAPVKKATKEEIELFIAKAKYLGWDKKYYETT